MSEKEQLNTLRDELKAEFMQNLMPFWTGFAIDEVNGGFVGRVTWDNQKVYNAPKGGILNARLLWAFSAASKQFEIEELKTAANRTFDYFQRYFVDKEYGGFYWLIDHKGKVLDDKKHIYTQAFGIYGLIEYYSATGNKDALRLAKKIYDLIEKHATDSRYGGYFESYNRKWELSNDARLSDKDKNEPKSMNTHLHVMEAYTNMLRVVPGEELREKLVGLVTYFFKFIVNREGSSLVNFMDEDWSPRSDLISYGHDIEASWLLAEAAEVVGDQAMIETASSLALSIARSVIAHGTDADGGLINEADSKGIKDSDKDWWPQVEAMIGFLNAYEISGDRMFLDATVKSWEFIKKYLIDREHGEWFEKVSRNGVPYDTMDKVRSWKGPYHNMRGILEITKRVERLTVEENITA